MEDTTVEIEKAIGTVQELQAKHEGKNPFYLRESDLSQVPQFRELQRKHIELLQAVGALTLEPYSGRQWIENESGQLVRNTESKPVPGTFVATWTEKGEGLLRARITKTTEVTELFQVPEPREVKEKRRSFMRTERGNTIMNTPLEGLPSLVNHHIQIVRDPNTAKSMFHGSQMWLMHIIGNRYDHIPEHLRHEAEDCRDLPYVGKRRKPS